MTKPSPARPIAPRFAVAALVAALGATSGGCAGPYRSARTLAAVSVGVLAAGTALWVAGERAPSPTMSRVGAGGVVAGTAAAIAAGAWLVASTSCRVDPDCPDDETCREIPAPPGREPYKQCAPR